MSDLAAKLNDNRQWLLGKLRMRPEIDCTGCGGKCCYDRAIFLYPELGDVPNDYDTEQAYDAYFGRWGRMLKHKPPDAEGRSACIYLTDDGKCGVWRRRPTACKAWSCVVQAGLLSRADEHRLKREGKWKPELQEGKQRLALIKNGVRQA